MPSTVHRCPKCDGIAKLDEQPLGVATMKFRCPYCDHAWEVVKSSWPQDGPRTPKQHQAHFRVRWLPVAFADSGRELLSISTGNAFAHRYTSWELRNAHAAGRVGSYEWNGCYQGDVWIFCILQQVSSTSGKFHSLRHQNVAGPIDE